jgi:uncharacterized sulfatase
LRERLAALPDLGFIPEPVFLAHGIDNPVRYGLEQKATITRLMDIADLPLQPAAEARARLQPILETGTPLERYWALIAATALGKEAATLAPSIRSLASEGEDRLVATRAAEFLAIVAGEDPRPVLTRTLRRAGSAVEASLILNTVVTLQDHYGYPAPSVAADWLPEAWRDDATVGPRLRYLADPETQ